MPVVEVNGKRISYWIGKDGAAKETECILFIHGAGGGQYTWSCQKVFFEKQSNPIMIELPGHGASEGEGEKEIGSYAQHVYSFLKALGFSKVFLVGHSMGGAIAQTLALTHPEVIKGIILVGTGARLRVLPVLLDGIKSNFEETVRKINQLHYSPKAPSDLIGKSLANMLQYRPEILYGDYLACDRFDVMNEVEKISLPTLIVCGSEDELTPVKYSQFLHDRIKRSKLVVLPDAGHMVMMESPEAFNETIGQFVLGMTSSKTV